MIILVPQKLSIPERKERVKSFLNKLSDGNLHQIRIDEDKHQKRCFKFDVFFNEEGNISDVIYQQTSETINEDYEKELRSKKQSNTNYFNITIMPKNLVFTVFPSSDDQNEESSLFLKQAKKEFINDLSSAFREGQKSINNENNLFEVVTDPNFEFEIK